MSGGGNGGGDSPLTSGQVQAINLISREGMAAVESLPTTGFQGPFMAGPDPLQLESLGMTEDFARGLIQQGDFGQGLTTGVRATAEGQFTDPNNPLLAGAIDAATRPLFGEFASGLNRLNTGAFATGAFDNTRRNIEAANLTERAGRAIGDVGASIALPFVQGERQLQQQAQFGLPQLIEQESILQQLPADILAGVGDARRQFAQEDIQGQQAAFQEQFNAPFRRLQPLAQLLGTTGTPQANFPSGPEGPSAVARGLTGALGGAAAGSVFGPWGAVAGGVIGGTAAVIY